MYQDTYSICWPSDGKYDQYNLGQAVTVLEDSAGYDCSFQRNFADGNVNSFRTAFTNAYNALPEACQVHPFSCNMSACALLLLWCTQCPSHEL